jgi:hypothetical protein
MGTVGTLRRQDAAALRPSSDSFLKDGASHGTFV